MKSMKEENMREKGAIEAKTIYAEKMKKACTESNGSGIEKAMGKIHNKWAESFFETRKIVMMVPRNRISTRGIQRGAHTSCSSAKIFSCANSASRRSSDCNTVCSTDLPPPRASWCEIKEWYENANGLQYVCARFGHRCRQKHKAEFCAKRNRRQTQSTTDGIWKYANSHYTTLNRQSSIVGANQKFARIYLFHNQHANVFRKVLQLVEGDRVQQRRFASAILADETVAAAVDWIVKTSESTQTKQNQT